MREIKFRAWDKKRNCWNYTLFELDADGEMIQADWFEMCQFTGQPDINGKDIYDGDILLSATGERYIVIWEEDGWRRESIDKIQSRTGLFPHSRRQEIIGNIYENADLIKHFKLII